MVSKQEPEIRERPAPSSFLFALSGCNLEGLNKTRSQMLGNFIFHKLKLWKNEIGGHQGCWSSTGSSGSSSCNMRTSVDSGGPHRGEVPRRPNRLRKQPRVRLAKSLV